MLVQDWLAHEKMLRQAQQEKPDWYVSEQIEIQDKGPWRHHLAKRRAYVTQAISSYLNGKGREQADSLLDLGCGDGANARWLKTFTRQLYCSDYNLVRLCRAQRLLGADVELFLADVLDFPIQDDFFEVVFFNHALEHIPDDLTALKTVRRILQPGGLLVLGIPNEGVWWWQLAYRLQPETLRTTDHLHFYTAGSISTLLEEAGLSLLEIEHLGWGPPHWDWDARIRGYKWVDDAFEWVGRRLFPQQSSSLYVLGVK